VGSWESGHHIYRDLDSARAAQMVVRIDFYTEAIKIQYLQMNTTISYLKPTFLEDTIDIVTRALDYDLPIHWKNIKEQIAKIPVPATIMTQEELLEIFGKVR
jgi:hypothetical protein